MRVGAGPALVTSRADETRHRSPEKLGHHSVVALQRRPIHTAILAPHSDSDSVEGTPLCFCALAVPYSHGNHLT